MADSTILKFYIVFLLVFGTLISGFGIEGNNFDLSSYTIVFNMFQALNGTDGLFSILSYVLLPFIILDILVLIMGMMFFTFTTIPTYLTTIILTPLGIFIVIDYLIPTIRGN